MPLVHLLKGHRNFLWQARLTFCEALTFEIELVHFLRVDIDFFAASLALFENSLRQDNNDSMVKLYCHRSHID
jgi:hypothetical protein